MVAAVMAIYYVALFLFFGLIVWAILAIVDVFAKTSFAPRYRAWLAGVEDWRKKTFQRDRKQTVEQKDESWRDA